MKDFNNKELSEGDKVLTYDVTHNGIHFREGVIEAIEKKVDDEHPIAQEWATIVFTHKIGGEEYKIRVFRTSSAIIKI
jgi:hypothetical protein